MADIPRTGRYTDEGYSREMGSNIYPQNGKPKLSGKRNRIIKTNKQDTKKK